MKAVTRTIVAPPPCRLCPSVGRGTTVKPYPPQDVSVVAGGAHRAAPTGRGAPATNRTKPVQQKPNSMPRNRPLTPIERPPFLALRARPASILRPQFEPLPGLPLIVPGPNSPVQRRGPSLGSPRCNVVIGEEGDGTLESLTSGTGMRPGKQPTEPLHRVVLRERVRHPSEEAIAGAGDEGACRRRSMPLACPESKERRRFGHHLRGTRPVRDGEQST